MASIESIEGIGPANGKKLRAAGIRGTGSLLSSCCGKPGRKALASDTGISEGMILEWVNRADLMRIKGVSTQYSDLLEAAGVDTVKELRNRNAENLHAKMGEVNETKKLVRRPPSLGETQRWVAHAKELKPMVTH